MIRPIAILASCIVVSLVAVSGAAAHGVASNDYRATILSIEPDGLPVDVRIVNRDQVRFENGGDKLLVVCGYENGESGDECEEWVRIGEDGVFVDKNANSYYANLDSEQPGPVPEGAGEKADWQRVRTRPPFYAYHDHRVHWMGIAPPPGVDQGDSSPQKVFDSEVRFRYGDTDGVINVRLEYVGGSSWLSRHGEQLIVGSGIVVMLVVFGLDARRRRRRTRSAAADEG